MDGFLLIDKEKGMTSFDVIRIVRRELGVKKVGHSGTLDKSATGLLILGIGKGTKRLADLLKCDKEYEVVAKFGEVSNTYDSAGEVKSTGFDGILSREEIESAMEGFRGEIEQMPPKYSALKIKGRRASDIMRSGGDVELKVRRLVIYKFEIIEYNWPSTKFLVECSSGTYIRSLVHDLGQKLDCGAYVVNLRRNKIADFSVADACKAGEVNKKIEQALISLDEMDKYI